MVMAQRRVGISTVSLGWHPDHTLELKLAAAAAASFAGVEIFHPDLDAFARSQHVTLLEAANHVRQICLEKELTIVCLSSFDNFEGSVRNLSDRLTNAKFWIQLARALGTNMIQVPSNDDKSASGDEATLITELRALADLGAGESPILFAYEALAWGTHVADWEESLRIVQLVDRVNFGLCLDTYHILARLWADPASQNGMRPGGTTALNASIKRFLSECPLDRVFYIQLSDAERCDPPLLPEHPVYRENKDPTHSGCSWGRLFPGELSEGAYLPVTKLCEALISNKGSKSWIVMEVFHRSMREKNADPEHWAKRGMASWVSCVDQIPTSSNL